MTDSEASKLVNEIKPKYAVPVHYGEVGSDKNASNFVSQLDSDIKGIILNLKKIIFLNVFYQV